MLKRFKPKSEFNRNILTLMTGTTIAQAIPIAISPILTRIYTPEDFGIFANIPKSSGVYILVRIGLIAIGIACAIVVPVINVKIFLLNSDFGLNRFNIFSKFYSLTFQMTTDIINFIIC